MYSVNSKRKVADHFPATVIYYLTKVAKGAYILRDAPSGYKCGGRQLCYCSDCPT